MGDFVSSISAQMQDGAETADDKRGGRNHTEEMQKDWASP